MGHDLVDLNLTGRLALENDLAGIVALGNDAHEPLALHDQQCPDTLVCHLFDGLIDCRAGSQEPHIPTLVIQEIPDSLHGGDLPLLDQFYGCQMLASRKIAEKGMPPSLPRP